MHVPFDICNHQTCCHQPSQRLLVPIHVSSCVGPLLGWPLWPVVSIDTVCMLYVLVDVVDVLCYADDDGELCHGIAHTRGSSCYIHTSLAIGRTVGSASCINLNRSASAYLSTRPCSQCLMLVGSKWVSQPCAFPTYALHYLCGFIMHLNTYWNVTSDFLHLVPSLAVASCYKDGIVCCMVWKFAYFSKSEGTLTLSTSTHWYSNMICRRSEKVMSLCNSSYA
jgi:hypothetical protein